nr:hypothetical protein [uncultured Duganella sp.]
MMVFSYRSRVEAGIAALSSVSLAQAVVHGEMSGATKLMASVSGFAPVAEKKAIIGRRDQAKTTSMAAAKLQENH